MYGYPSTISGEVDENPQNHIFTLANEFMHARKNEQLSIKMDPIKERVDFSI